MRRKNTAEIKKRMMSAGIGLLTAATVFVVVPVPGYAAQAGTIQTQDEIPGVSAKPGNTPDGKPKPGTSGGKGNGTGDTVFGVAEVETVWYRLTMIVKDRKTDALLSGAAVYFERMNDDGRGSVGGIVYEKDSGNKLVRTDESGQLTFELEVGKRYKIYVLSPSGYLAFVPDENQPEYIQIDNGSQNQSRIIYLDKEEPKPTDPKPTQPTKPSHNGGGGGGNGGGSGGGSHGSSEPETTAPPVTPTESSEPARPGTQETLPDKPSQPETSPAKPGVTTEPTSPDKEKDREYVLPGKDGKTGTEDDIVVRPEKDPNGKDNSSQDKEGKVTLPDGGTVIYPSFPEQGDIKGNVPPGTIVHPDGSLVIPKGERVEYILPGKDAQIDTDDDVRVIPELDDKQRDVAEILADGSLLLRAGGTVIYADGETIQVPSGTIVLPDGTIIYPEKASEETSSNPSGHSFGDCWFHWLELIALLLILLSSAKRLLEIRMVHNRLDELEDGDRQERDQEKEE